MRSMFWPVLRKRPDLFRGVRFTAGCGRFASGQGGGKWAKPVPGVEGGTLEPFGRVGSPQSLERMVLEKKGQKAIVRGHHQPVLAARDQGPSLRAHTGIDHSQDHAGLGQMRYADIQKEGPLFDLVRNHPVGDVQQRTLGGLPHESALELADVRVGKAEIGQ